MIFEEKNVAAAAFPTLWFYPRKRLFLRLAWKRKSSQLIRYYMLIWQYTHLTSVEWYCTWRWVILERKQSGTRTWQMAGWWPNVSSMPRDLSTTLNAPALHLCEHKVNSYCATPGKKKSLRKVDVEIGTKISSNQEASCTLKIDEGVFMASVKRKEETKLE